MKFNEHSIEHQSFWLTNVWKHDFHPFVIRPCAYQFDSLHFCRPSVSFFSCLEICVPEWSWMKTKVKSNFSKHMNTYTIFTPSFSHLWCMCSIAFFFSVQVYCPSPARKSVASNVDDTKSNWESTLLKEVAWKFNWKSTILIKKYINIRFAFIQSHL